ncbi:hypothetical protein GALMADRAFT_222059 [Galerina marginata CBS 339.88]|uniref:Cytochrome P450 n=1 Tax=Galerina marginata (strain CBS 339.88) TaxID=685588 RepID=A0A067TGA5_GALM3|nr:hypothetical protein GALMADRAFT_222059 [Galerina marginata CBS 339.88]
MPLPLNQDAFILGTLVVCFVYWVNGQRQRRQLPPGPKKLPFIGNLLSMPSRVEWETFARWGQEYNSDIIHVNALGTSIVILNSYNVASDLLDKRSGTYSDRPHFTMLHELSGWGFLFSLLPYGDVWRESRRLFTKHFNSSHHISINQKRDIIYVRRLLGQLLQRPNDFLQHARTLVGSTTLSMTYSINVQPYNDPYIAIAEDAVETAGDLLIAGAFLVDIIPILKYVPDWFPGAKFQRKAAIMRAHAAKIRDATFEATKKLMASGDYNPSFVTEALTQLEYSEHPGRDLDILKDVAAQTYMAGADTTASALGTFFLAMVCYPQVQKKAQEELDKVLNGKLPEANDIRSLPYLSALIKEVYRNNPTFLPHQGVPHQTIGDDLYNDYHIPAKSVVIANQWAMLNDERDYPLPREFRPERFLKNGSLDKSVRDPMDIAFGFGRRVCAGKHLAHSTITLAAASVLSTFDLLRKLDENHLEIEPRREYKPSAICQPIDFPCVIKPRSRHAAELIRSSSGLDLDE